MYYLFGKLLPGMKTLICALCIVCPALAVSGQNDSTKAKATLTGLILVTNNGIAQIPAYSLDRPAASALLFLKIRRFSYEPDFNFALDGRPWGFGHSFFYHVAHKNKFRLRMGPALGLAFSYPEVMQNGELVRINKGERYFITKILPSYIFSRRTTLSLIYWNGQNLEKQSINSINFLSALLSITQLPLGNKLYTSWYPQVFYLNVDGDDGLFLSPVVAVGVKNIPFYLSSQVNATLWTKMNPRPAFKWNVAVNYAFAIPH